MNRTTKQHRHFQMFLLMLALMFVPVTVIGSLFIDSIRADSIVMAQTKENELTLTGSTKRNTSICANPFPYWSLAPYHTIQAPIDRSSVTESAIVASSVTSSSIVANPLEPMESVVVLNPAAITPIVTKTPVAVETLSPTAESMVTPKPTVAPATAKKKEKKVTITVLRPIEMYEKDDDTSALICKIKAGSKLKVTDAKYGWLKTSHKGKDGFVFYLYTNYLQKIHVSSPVYQTKMKHSKGFLTADQVHLRDRPGVIPQSKILDVLPVGTTFQVIGYAEMLEWEENGWLKVKVLKTGQIGYVYAKYVSVETVIEMPTISDNKKETKNEVSKKKDNKKDSSEEESDKKNEPDKVPSKKETAKEDKSSSKKEDICEGSSGSKGSKSTKKSSSKKEDTCEGSGGSNGKSFNGIELRYSAKYNVTSNPLTRSMGVKRYNGHRETYYSQKVLPGGGLHIPGRHVAKDGTIRDKDGYICVATDWSFIEKGSVVMTSLGPAKVYDTGCSYGTVDIYVNW